MARHKEKRVTKKLKKINRSAAGIDIGARCNFVAVDPSCAAKPVREFSAFTAGHLSLADWLSECKVTTVAMEATGVYWIPLFEILESRGFEVVLVNARHVKNVPGRKSDVIDCQWLQELHSYGLLQASFRPDQGICTLRSYVRQRGTLIRYASSHILHMQKALCQMNILLHQVVSDITGLTGLRIIRAIIDGERDPQKLAALRDGRCKRDETEIARALHGNYRPEHIWQLQLAFEAYEFYQQQIQTCDSLILAHLEILSYSEGDGLGQFDGSLRRSSVEEIMRKLTGADLTKIEGISTSTALTILSEIGTDMSRWKSAKHFSSWLGLCPGTKISGGKVMDNSSRKVVNRAATALRLAAFSLHQSKSAIGAFLRRLKSRIGAPKAITATAHKLARIIYNLLKYGAEYVATGQKIYENQYQARKLKVLTINAKSLGFKLVPISP